MTLKATHGVLTERALDAIDVVLSVAIDGKIASDDIPETRHEDLERAQAWVRAEKARRAKRKAHP